MYILYQSHTENRSPNEIKNPKQAVIHLMTDAGSGWGAGAKTLRTAALSLVYSTAEYCAPVWCRSAHTQLIDSVLNDVLRIVTGCLRPTPTDYLPILAVIQPAELRRRGATLSLANRAALNPDHILHEQLVGKQNAHQGRLKFYLFYLVAYLSSYHEKAINALYELA